MITWVIKKTFKEVSLEYKERWQLTDVIQFQVQIFTAEAGDQWHSYLNATAKDTPFFHDGSNKFIH